MTPGARGPGHGAQPVRVRQRLPVAMVHAWLRGPRSWSDLAGEPDLVDALAAPGVDAIGDGRIAVAPSRGAAQIFDIAVHVARAVLRAAGGSARVFVAPGVRDVDAAGADAWSDPLSGALARRPPDLPWNAVYLSSHAVHRLEGRFRQMPRGVYQIPSGPGVPLVRLGRPRRWDDPRRNPQPLGRTIKGIARPVAAAALRERLEDPILRVEGLLGCGKSRLVWEARGEEFAWCVCSGGHSSGGRSLADQLFTELLSHPRSGGRLPSGRPSGLSRRELVDAPLFFALRVADACTAAKRGTRPFRLVIDALEDASMADLELIDALGAMPQIGDALRVTLIGRTGSHWPSVAARAPSVRVPRLGLAEAEALGTAMMRGLSVPDEVLKRFVAASGGIPLALEEGLHGLIHGGGLRRIYGSLFFSGSPTAPYVPSERWICQVVAETERLGELAPMLALAAAGSALPADVARAAESERSSESPEEPASWVDAFRRADWLVDTETPWGSGVEAVCPATLAALAWTLPPVESSALRRAIGARLVERRADGAAGWAAYELLRGAPEAIPALLGAARDPEALAAGGLDALLDALAQECARADPATRLDLLWALLPLAHQHGRLDAYTTELDAAMALSADQPKKLLAFGALRAELQESQGRFTDAEGSLRRALETAIARTGHADRKALLSIRLGRVLLRDERFAEARRLFEEIQPLLDRTERTTLAASCDFYLGNIALHEDRLDDARAYHEVALATRRDKKQREAVGASLSALGAVALAQGFYAEALERFASARRTLGDAGDPSFELLGEGRALDRMGDFAGASALLRQALALRLGRTDAAAEAVVRIALAENQLNLDHADIARRELMQAHFALSLRSPSRALGDVECLLGRVALRQRRLAEARSHFAAAFEIHRTRQDRSAAIMDLGWQLETARLLDDRVEGERALAEGSTAFDRAPYPERGEIADLAFFHGAAWLRGKGATGSPEALPFLQRAYENLVRKMARLSPENRNRYLLQVATNREIVQAATAHGIPATA